MVSPASAPARTGRKVNAFQALALLVAFVLVSALGGVLTAGLVMPAVATTSAVTDTSVRLFDDLPSELEPQPLSQQSRVWAADGALLATFFWENRIVVPLADISQEMQDAVVATEDKRFFEHGGVDLAGMARALVRNATSDETEGGSTLTQQYVKNVLIEAAHSEGDLAAVAAATESEGTAGYARKLSEAKMAIALEKRLTKEEILEGYLNIAQFGPSVYGVEAAAQHYFSKSAKDLNWLQAATIAGITQKPNEHDPVSNPEVAETRRNTVATLMRDQGLVSEENYQAGIAIPIEETLRVSTIDPGCAGAGGAAYFCDYVTDVIMNSEEFGADREERRTLLYRGGLDIYTTIDLAKQAAADKALRDVVPQDDESGLANALVAVEPGTGHIVAMAQNRTFNPHPDPEPGETAVNYSTGKAYGGSNGFQVGSTFKPFVLAEWLRQGKSLNTIVSAERKEYKGDSWTASCGAGPFGAPWRPVNFDGGGSGSMSVLRATANSVNTAYVSMLHQLDLCKAAETAKTIGFERADGRDMAVVPSMVLGSNETSPLIMASAYATFASGGTYCEPIAITRVTDPSGTELPVPQANCRSALDERVANTVTYALTKVMTEGSGRDAQLSGRPSAGKTGTTNENWQTWFVGYTPQLVSAVWTGNPDRNVPMQRITVNGRYHRIVYGSVLAAPAWDRFMTAALEGAPVERFPDADRKMLYGDRVSVPNVVGRSFGDAEAILREAGFQVTRGGSAWSDVRKGAVASTNPGPGSRVNAGSAIQLVESRGPEPKQDDADDRPGRGGGGD
ncbi:PASTA domain-containing protein [Cellulomonas sp. APG4]|uniref:transglycosylase domain-containing protein n=1 Tax=Cellulomonas sp. APG4 TaxID=1538656 RepID=UPI00137B6F7C|nr:transglycosylase domain-containing protein [Cellulomonas sp. APG4]NCT91299.1 PASTA domain-containing protein [Cellulomonas sp. APG4]